MPTIPAPFFLSSRDFRPAYLDLGMPELRRRTAEALDLLRSCVACPRDCHVNRLEDRYAVCKTGRYARVSSFFPHFGEEDCLRGWRGSGTVFFAWCNLKCAFCLTPEVRILTDQGMRRIEDLFLSAGGEVSVDGGRCRFPEHLRVWTRRGTLAPVSKVFCHDHDGEVVIIKPAGLPPITVTPEHAVYAARTPATPGSLEQIPAGMLTRRHYLLVPRTLAAESRIELDVRTILQPHVGTFRGSVRRRVPIGILQEAYAVRGAGHPTAAALACQFGYHPAYREGPDGHWVPIRRIERRHYHGPVYNLEVADSDHSYLAQGAAVGNCQNFDISQLGQGRLVSPADLARMMLYLQDAGCHNINFVTPEHVVPQILEALPPAVELGLRLPLVYNTSAYDSLHSLRLLDGIVDIYMPDFKFWDGEMSRLYLKARDYPEVARAVISAMHRQVGPLKFDEHGLAKRGVLLRHLVMPRDVAGTGEILRWLAAEVSPHTYVNLMDQYRPAGRVGTDARYDAINRRISSEEFREALRAARELGLHRLDVRAPRSPRVQWVPA